MGLLAALGKFSRISSLIVLGSVVSVPSLFSQESVAPEPMCPECRVQLEHLTTLGDNDGPGLIGDSPLVVMGSDRFYVAAAQPAYQVQVFSENGRFLRVLGRRGQGPGEFQRIWGMNVDEGGSLHVFDAGIGRWTVFSPALDLVRNVRLPFPPINRGATLVLPNGSALLNAAPRTSALAGSFYHLLGRDGSLSRSIGNAPIRPRLSESEDPRLELAPYRVVAPSGDSGFWSTGVGEYALEQWSFGGEPLRTPLIHDPSWFQVQGPVGGEGMVGAPVPLILSLEVDSASRVWVSGQGADENWEEAVSRFRVEDRQGYWDGFIDVIDPIEGRIVASTRMPGGAIKFLGEGHAYRYRSDDLGVVYVDIYRVHLINSAQEEERCGTLLSRLWESLLRRRPCPPSSATGASSTPTRTSIG